MTYVFRRIASCSQGMARGSFRTFAGKPNVARIGAALGRLGLGRMAASEYQANLNGLNMFFGAVLGFVLAGTEKLSDVQFGVVLLLLAGVVITILYISASRSRITYALLALACAASFPEMVDYALKGQDLVPGKLRPTLLVWTILAIAIEFWARDKASDAQE